MHDQDQVLADCQQQLADSSSKLKEQHLQQSLLSQQSAVIIASLQSKVQASPLSLTKLFFACAALLWYSIYMANLSINAAGSVAHIWVVERH